VVCVSADIGGYMIRSFCFVGTVVIWSVVSVFAFAETSKKAATPPSKSTLQEFMASKRFHMGELFDGVLNKNFEQAAEKAKVLMMLSKASTWHQIDSEDYKRHSNLFQESLRFFIEKAEAKSVEGVSLGYVRLAMSCMHCHHEVRWAGKP
jgi:hypothetical protein